MRRILSRSLTFQFLWLFFKVFSPLPPPLQHNVQQHCRLSSSTLNFQFPVEIFKVYALDRVRQRLLPAPSRGGEEKEDETWCPQVQFIFKVVDFPVVRQILVDSPVASHMVVDVPVVPTAQRDTQPSPCSPRKASFAFLLPWLVLSTMMVPQLLFVEKLVVCSSWTRLLTCPSACRYLHGCECAGNCGGTAVAVHLGCDDLMGDFLALHTGAWPRGRVHKGHGLPQLGTSTDGRGETVVKSHVRNPSSSLLASLHIHQPLLLPLPSPPPTTHTHHHHHHHHHHNIGSNRFFACPFVSPVC